MSSHERDCARERQLDIQFKNVLGGVARDLGWLEIARHHILVQRLASGAGDFGAILIAKDLADENHQP